MYLWTYTRLSWPPLLLLDGSGGGESEQPNILLKLSLKCEKSRLRAFTLANMAAAED